MPIVLNDDNKAAVVDVTGGSAAQVSKVAASCTPKFFHNSVLTGHGGTSRGLLNEAHDPKMYPKGYPVNVNPNLEQGTHYNKDLKIYDVPIFILTPHAWSLVKKLDRPDPVDMVRVAKGPNKQEVWLWMPIHAVQVEEKVTPPPPGSNGSAITKRTISACFNQFVFFISDHTDLSHERVDGSTVYAASACGGTMKNTFVQGVVFDMVRALRDLEKDLTAAKYVVDKQALQDFLTDYSLYTEICKSAERWQTKADYYIADVMMRNVDEQYNHPTTFSGLNGSAETVTDVLSRLEKRSVPLDQYQSMYAKMAAIVEPDVLKDVCKANLNLKLSDTLQHMHQNRAQLLSVPCNVHIQGSLPYSVEQRGAIESTSPLTLVQSGAGTGKSTVILGRIDHMVANGVNPDDITVLSFTNAAADHIVDMKPGIHSMTIASMLHTIYVHNYPNQQLSSLSTIINSIDIYFNNSTTKSTLSAQQIQFLSDFQYCLQRLRDNGEYTRMVNFVEDHMSEVLDTLDTIEQTTLELESIICYLNMDTLVEPPEVQTKHLIVDEVQDNSVSEFIYTIKYTDKHMCSLYIVGKLRLPTLNPTNCGNATRPMAA